MKLLLFNIFLIFSFITSGTELKNNSYKKTITVTNEKEFIDALKDNTKIIIKTKELDLSYYNIIPLLPIGSTKIKIDERRTLVLDNFINLEITAETKVNIFVGWPEQAVLLIKNSRDIILNNLRMYHKVPTTETCEGGVLDIENVKGIQIQNCELNGSGVYGVYFSSVTEAVMQQSQIYNNSRHAIVIYFSEVMIKDSRIFKNPSFILFWITDDSKVYFNNCSIEDNTVKESIINPLTTVNFGKEGENSTEVTFEDCTFNNNLRGYKEVIPSHIFYNPIIELRPFNFIPIYPVYREQFYEFIDNNNTIYSSDEIKNLYNSDIEEYNNSK